MGLSYRKIDFGGTLTETMRTVGEYNQYFVRGLPVKAGQLSVKNAQALDFLH